MNAPTITDWRVNQAFLKDSEEELIKRCFSSSNLPADEISVKQLGRYGKSGARLLLCHLGEIPYVVKIHDKEKIENEHSRMTSVCRYFREASDLPAPPVFIDGDGALLYRYRGDADKEKRKGARTLSEMLYESEDYGQTFSSKDEEITLRLDGTWHQCESARGVAKVQPFVFLEGYSEYLRQKKASDVLKSIFGPDRTKEEFEFLGSPVNNPLVFIEHECFRAKQEVKTGPVHGDLHATNVMVDKYSGVQLIDFAWAHPSNHVLIDYVLMENSVRFLLFPHQVNPGEQLKVDTKLLDADGAEALKVWNKGSPLDGYYRRLGVVLSHIRGAAADLLRTNDDRGFLEYLAAQFLILFGQMAYPDYNRLIAARALGLIAQRLAQGKFAA